MESKNENTKELILDKETASGLYRIICGLSKSCYENAEVYDETKLNMKKAFETVRKWGEENKIDPRGDS